MTSISNTQFKKATLRIKLTSRGGGIEIDLDLFGYPHAKVTAYQNYLGGGMLSSIGSSYNGKGGVMAPILHDIQEQLKKYFHKLSGNQTPFTELQQRSLSAY